MNIDYDNLDIKQLLIASGLHKKAIKVIAESLNEGNVATAKLVFEYIYGKASNNHAADNHQEHDLEDRLYRAHNNLKNKLDIQAN